MRRHSRQSALRSCLVCFVLMIATRVEAGSITWPFPATSKGQSTMQELAGDPLVGRVGFDSDAVFVLETFRADIKELTLGSMSVGRGSDEFHDASPTTGGKQVRPIITSAPKRAPAPTQVPEPTTLALLCAGLGLAVSQYARSKQHAK
jgi:hypothetical protein